MSIMSGWIGTILGFILALIPLIIVHEFGHFVMARLMGVWANEFGIGLPPRMLKLFKWRETEFTLNWLPLGGFVRLEGEEPPGTVTSTEAPEADPSAAEERRAHSLYSKSPLRRILIYLGGPLMNILAAWVIAVLIFNTGLPAFQIGIGDTAPGSPAEQAGILPGDIIATVDGVEIETMDDVTEIISRNLGRPVTLGLLRDGEPVEITLTPRVDPPEGQGAMGVIITGVQIPGRLQYYSFGDSLVYGTRLFVQTMGITVLLPVYIVRMRIPLADARPVGVIGISQIAQDSVESSISVGAAYPFLQVLILLSVSLGVFNLLPIPALDGGRILFSLIEKVRGKRLPPHIEERIHQITYAALLLLFVFITVLDIVAPVQLP